MIKVYELRALQNNYIVSVPFKGVKVRCEFKNGNIAKGIHARLYTNDPFRQMAIEQSRLYGNTWHLVEKVKEPEDEAREVAKNAERQAWQNAGGQQAGMQDAAGKAKQEPLPTGNGAGADGGETAAREQGDGAGEQGDGAGAQEAAPGEDGGETAASEQGDGASEQGDAAGAQKLEFANLGEAIVYVAIHFGKQVENENQARKVFADNGIKVVIHKG